MIQSNLQEDKKKQFYKVGKDITPSYITAKVGKLLGYECFLLTKIHKGLHGNLLLVVDFTLSALRKP